MTDHRPILRAHIRDILIRGLSRQGDRSRRASLSGPRERAEPARHRGAPEADLRTHLRRVLRSLPGYRAAPSPLGRANP
ncbi:hypothetical protein [Methylobacterium planeticum]|uniref:Uncharacterized protein n=1 Tax=Methylobacterium planeticum TaxID=2615211 RepID=A0A6N6MLB7_9HYPH|nr:hypothetical protein [Methylobacterium planeticum]KAB1070848.1 hypothetical protein F6X51_21210 [Methylobacterium planeticum]